MAATIAYANHRLAAGLALAVACLLAAMLCQRQAVAQQPRPFTPRVNHSLGKAYGGAPAVFNYWGGLVLDRQSLRRLDKDAEAEGRNVPLGKSQNYDSLWIQPEDRPSTYYRLAPPSREPAFAPVPGDFNPNYRPPTGCCRRAPICVHRYGWEAGECPQRRMPSVLRDEATPSFHSSMPRP